jgi:hypothetical protein
MASAGSAGGERCGGGIDVATTGTLSEVRLAVAQPTDRPARAHCLLPGFVRPRMHVTQRAVQNWLSLTPFQQAYSNRLNLEYSFQASITDSHRALAQPDKLPKDKKASQFLVSA